MGVIFQSLGGVSGVTLQTTFTPNYANNGNVDPTQFIVNRGSLGSTDFVNVDIVNASQMRFARSGGVGGTASPIKLFAVPILNTAVIGKRQFAQGTFVSNVNAIDNGPACHLTGDLATDQGATNGGNGYFLSAHAGDALMYVRRCSISESVVFATGIGFVGGDVFRIEVTPGVGSNSINVFKNGVSLGVTVDNNAARVPFGQGWPGWFDGGAPLGGITIWSNQSWGVF